MDPNPDSSSTAIPSGRRTDTAIPEVCINLLLWSLALVLLGLSVIALPGYGSILSRLVGSALLLLLLELIGAAYLWYAAIAAIAFLGIWHFASRPLQRKSVFVLGIAVGIYASSIASWYVPRPQVANRGGTSLAIMAYNVNYKLWDTASVTANVREHPADILGLVEPLTADAAELREEVRDLYPYYYRSSAGNLSLLSRYPILAAETDNLGTSVYSLLALVDVAGQPLRVVVAHPPPPTTRGRFVTRNNTIAALADYARDRQMPTVVMGDFNATSWSIYLQNFVRRSGLRSTALGRGIKPTWNYLETGRPQSLAGRAIRLLKIPIDHIFVSEAIRVEDVRTAPAGVSDHRPLIARLRMPS